MPGADVRRFAEAIKGAGIDTRFWSSHATVCSVNESGEPNFTDPQAVVSAPDGVVADVMLMPLEIPITARVQLGVGGRCRIDAPLHAGDEVLVVIPDGDLNNPLSIVAILNSRAHPVPLDSDGMPVFKNDRLMVFARDVPVEIRTPTARVQVTQDGKVNLGDADATEKVIKGTTYTDDENAMLFGPASLLQAFTLLEGVAVGPFAVFKPGFLLAKEVISLYQKTVGNHLSDVTRTK